MTVTDPALGNLKMKRDNGKKGLKIMNNNDKKLSGCNKRGSTQSAMMASDRLNLNTKISTKGDRKRDHGNQLNEKKNAVSDHHVYSGKEKRRRMDCQMTLLKEKECSSSDHSSCVATAAIDEGCTTSLNVDHQLSPTKALRAAQLKKRFADLIFKANHQSDHGDKLDSVKLQQERERLKKQQVAEKARIEEQIKAAEALLQMRAEAGSKMQRQRDREAARIKLEKMEKTVEFNDAMQIMRDFESLLNTVC